jgi:hypothetical protein
LWLPTYYQFFPKALYFQKFQCTFPSIFPYENFKNPLKLLNKKFELAQKLVDFSMHFFRIFTHEIFKDPLKVLNKKLKLGQKNSLTFAYRPLQSAQQKIRLPAKIKKTCTEIIYILRRSRREI